jgi:hypothetical protein
MASHSQLSPSRAHRYMPCPGSIVLEDSYQGDPGNEYTAEGTAAHELAALCLQEDRNAEAYLGRVFVVEADKKYEFEVDDEMVRHVQAYVSYVKYLTESLTNEPVLWVEHKVDLSHVLGPDQSGTADAIVFNDGVLDVVDLKYGKGVRVSAVDNPQALLYALGAMEVGLDVSTLVKVRVHIAQPRLDNWPVSEYTIEDMEQFRRKAQKAAAIVEDARRNVKIMDPGAWEETYLHPSADACKFCEAKGACPALAKEAIGTITGRPRAQVSGNWTDFTAPAKGHILALDNAGLGELRSRVDMVETWVKALVAEVDSRLDNGQNVPGWKRVKGNRAAPQWTSKDEAEKLLKSFRLRKDEMYTYGIINPTKARELITEPRRKTKVEELIRETGGLPTTVPSSDRREALVAEIKRTEEEDADDLIG